MLIRLLIVIFILVLIFVALVLSSEIYRIYIKQTASKLQKLVFYSTAAIACFIVTAWIVSKVLPQMSAPKAGLRLEILKSEISEQNLILVLDTVAVENGFIRLEIQEITDHPESSWEFIAWYSLGNSERYGMGVLRGKINENNNKIRVSVFDKDSECKVCSSLTTAFSDRNIRYFDLSATN